MHELAIAEALVEQASKVAAGARLRRITRLACRVGVLRMIDEALLNEAFEAVRKGTACEGASLAVERVHIRARCPDCGKHYVVPGDDWRCCACGAEGSLESGDDEFVLVNVEGTVDDDAG